MINKVKLYIDEDASRSSFVQALRYNNIDCVTTKEANNLGKDDLAQLIWATENNRVIYTFNVRDYCKLNTIYIEEKNTMEGLLLLRDKVILSGNN